MGCPAVWRLYNSFENGLEITAATKQRQFFDDTKKAPLERH